MPILQNSRHEKFAQLVASGKSGQSAYVEAGYAVQGAAQSSYTLLRKPDVADRIDELKQRTEAKADITRGEIIQILAAYARNDYDVGATYTHDVRLKAIAQLTKMTGWDAPDKVELGASNELTELLARLRGSG